MSFKWPLALALACSCLTAAAADNTPVDRATLDRIRDAAMKSDWAYQHLSDLTDKIGGRLAGSPQAEAAVQQVAEALRREGMIVRLEPVIVPHWVRGVETAELIDFPGHLPGIDQKIVLTALGGSSATPLAGMNGQVLVVNSVDELQSKAKQVSGKIVLINSKFDPHLEENGLASIAYGQAGHARFNGPAAGAALGASAVLVRSVSSAAYRLPHTGTTVWTDDSQRIPAAAVTAEDADLIARLAAHGPVTLHLTLTPQTLPDVPSSNVIAEIPGTDLKDEIVLISGHLDSWDLGQGAIDDGTGLISAMAAAQLIQSLHLQPRRTIRVVAWMDEELRQRGASAYQDAHQSEFWRTAGAIESDEGVGRPLGINARILETSMRDFAAVQASLTEIGASALVRRSGSEQVGSDIGGLQMAGIPAFSPLVDVRSYFNYHHTAADTLDKVDPDNLRRQVAVMAELCYFLAQTPHAIDRLPVIRPN